VSAEKRVIVHTDGACSGNPGPGGWGAILEYDGGPFVGWQRQENGPSVQQALEEAIHGFCGAVTPTTAAGRTDAGVHALGQVAHFDLAAPRAPDTVRDALNAHLRPHPIAILAAEAVPLDFDARRSALRRHYLYRIANRRPDLALDRGRQFVQLHHLLLLRIRVMFCGILLCGRSNNVLCRIFVCLG